MIWQLWFWNNAVSTIAAEAAFYVVEQLGIALSVLHTTYLDVRQYRPVHSDNHQCHRCSTKPYHTSSYFIL